MSLRRTLFWLLYSAMTLGVSLLLVEIVVRTMEIGPPLPERHKRAFIRKPHLPFHPTPNSRFEETTDEFSVVYQYNGQGLRDRERSVAKPPDTIRILGLGDSFTEGVGVNFIYSYLAQLEGLLRQAGQPPPVVDVVKAGVAGYDTEAERLYLEHYGVLYRPDVVIVGITGTDVFEMALGRHRVLSRQGYLLTRGAHALGPWGVELYMRSRAARIVLKPIAHRSFLNNINPKAMSEERRRGLRRLGWERVEAELLRILEINRGIGARTILLYVPVKPPFYLPVKPPFDEYAPEDSRLIRAFCGSHDVACVDMLPVFQRHPDSATLYFPRNGHCTMAGNRLIAEELFGHLQRSGWIDRQTDLPRQ